MVSFEEARGLVTEVNAPAWRDLGNRGEYMVADYGFESPEYWLVIEGARELIEGGDESFVVMDQPLTLVSKRDGSLVSVVYLDAAESIDAMTPVGDHPDVDPDA